MDRFKLFGFVLIGVGIVLGGWLGTYEYFEEKKITSQVEVYAGALVKGFKDR